MTRARRCIGSAGPGVSGLLTLLIAVCGFASARLAAQVLAPESPQFEVVSVKPSRPTTGPSFTGFNVQPGRFTGTSVSVRDLLASAYRMQGFQIIAGQSWPSTERFDIVAKAPGGQPSRDELDAMVRALLADRFGVVAHRETRNLPIYALVLARKDGRFGPRLRASAVDCLAQSAQDRGRGLPSSPVRASPPVPGSPIACGRISGPGTLSAGGVRLDQVAAFLESIVGRPVHDLTGLSGQFALELTWAPDLGAGGPLDDASMRRAGDGGTSIFTAVQEQLGLKLDAQQGSVDVLVVDKVQHPTPD